MVFANLIFLYLFLPLNLILYYISKNAAWRNGILILFSLFFYAWGEPVWVTLLLFSSVVDYIHGRVIGRWPGTRIAKAMVASSLVINLGLLGVFKYGAFFTGILNSFLPFSLPVPAFSLPIGISFYSFQTISYTVDVYWGKVEPQKSFGRFLMYVSLYPQLVAGPIVRYADVAWDIDHRTVNLQEISSGFQLFCFGLAKKVLIANTAGELVIRYLNGDLAGLAVAEAWFGVLMYAIQIYYDFSGYSDMAIGLGRMFGFHYPANFNYPYISRSVSEFWRRWHISLGSFFRDYVYIPLGGNRRHVYRNLAIVWFLTGLWHGASWNFILWGCYFGLLIMLERLCLRPVLERHRIFSHIYTGLAVLVSWAIFYFTDLTRLSQCLGALFGRYGNPLFTIQLQLTLVNNIFWLAAALLFLGPVTKAADRWLQRQRGRGIYSLARTSQVFMNAALLILSTACLVGESYNPFLYFRF